MESLYFAYGSNLSSARMRARVPSARARGGARLSGYRLALNKRSRDGSGKANLALAPEAWVFGVLYRLSAVHWAILDACEPGYQRIAVEVSTGGRHFAAQTYLSRDLTPRAVAYDWYKRLILEGAREHNLPRTWQQHLVALPARPADVNATAARPGDPRPRAPLPAVRR